MMITLADPNSANHGGTMRSRSLAEAIENAGFSLSYLFPDGPQARANEGHAATAITRASRLRDAIAERKRAYLPMPTEVGQRSSEMNARVSGEGADLTVVSALSQAQFLSRTTGLHWLDFMDLWSDFCEIESETRSGLAQVSARAQAKHLRKRELHYADNVEIVTCAGWLDNKRMQERGISSQWVPTPLPDREFRQLEVTHSARSVAGFIGNFHYWPNRDAAQLLLREWAPVLAQRGWEIIIAGSGSNNLSNLPPGVKVMGEVSSVDEFYSEISLALAPIRLGGGMKVKVIEALSRGIPVLGTRFAFEGFPPSLRKIVHSWDDGLRAIKPGTLPRIEVDAPSLAAFTQSSVNKVVGDLVTEALNRNWS